MNKKNVLELKKRITKDDCSFTKMCGCYVNSNKETLLKFRKTFLNLDEDEFFKYLEISKKILSGTMGNNLLQLDFPQEEESVGGKQYDLMELKKSGLKDDEILNKFYDSVIENYQYEGNYLILLFHDAYDVITKTKDNQKIDESEEVFEYIICAICKVSLSKAGLRYFEEDNKIGARIRDWLVEVPSNGFLFPAFTDRSSDIDSVLYYTKNPKDTHPEFMEGTLGCPSKTTATEQKEAFTNIIKNAAGGDTKKSEALFMEIQDNLNNMIDEHNAINDKDTDPAILSKESISEALAINNISEEISQKITKSYEAEFGSEPPIMEHLLDKKTLAQNEQRKKEERLKKKVEVLQTELEKQKENIQNDSVIDIIESENQSDNHSINDSPSYTNAFEKNNLDENNNIILKVNPDKISQIKSEVIDGKKCLIIPINDDEKATVNGVDALI